MKKRLIVLMFMLFLPAAVFSANVVEEYGNSFNKDADQTQSKADSHKAWFYDASLGLFLHWGIHSLMEQQPSWCMLKLKGHGEPQFPPVKYYAMANKFDPQHYDPDIWLAAAKKAGFTYAVMTSKHHDGYAMWPSKYGEMNSGKFLNGRDLLKPYVEACRKNGLRVGFYFSGSDWYHKDFPRQTYGATKVGLNYTLGGIDYSQWRRWPDDDPTEVERHLNGFYDYAKGQLRELLTNYGKIDVLWFDGFPLDWPESLKDHRKMVNARIEDIHKMIIELQPGIVINNRGNRIPGDFMTPERGDGSFPPDDYHVFHNDQWKRKWELCNLWGRGAGWGYSADGYHPNKGHDRNASWWVLERLAQCRAKGGNMLTNSGPTPNGKQPASFYQGCEEIAGWMQHSRASVIGAGALEDNWKDHSDVPVTTGEGVWYLHVFHHNKAKTISLKNIPSQPDRVVLLRTGRQLQYQKNAGVICIIVPTEMRTELDDVVAVYWKETGE